MYPVVSAASSDVVVDKKLMKNFEINWESMDYDKRVSRYNPKDSSNQQRSRADENLTLRCTVDIKDPNLIFGLAQKLSCVRVAEKFSLNQDRRHPGLAKHIKIRFLQMPVNMV